MIFEFRKVAVSPEDEQPTLGGLENSPSSESGMSFCGTSLTEVDGVSGLVRADQLPHDEGNWPPNRAKRCGTEPTNSVQVSA